MSGDPDQGSALEEASGESPRRPPHVFTDGWSYAGVTMYHIVSSDPLAVDAVHAIQQREASGGGDYLYRRVVLSEENRVGPTDGGSPDYRELEGEPMFDQAGVVTDHRDGPLTETAGVVMAEIGFQVEEPRWYWVPVEHEAERDCTCGPDEACDVCGGQP